MNKTLANKNRLCEVEILAESFAKWRKSIAEQEKISIIKYLCSGKQSKVPLAQLAMKMNSVFWFY